MNNKELVKKAITAVFVHRDLTAFDTYFDESYIQHNPQLPSGLDVLRQFIPTLGADFSYEPGIITEAGDLVMIHGRYTGWAGKTMIAVDIFRVANDRLVEHWDVMQEEIPADKTASGQAMFPIQH